jgi:FkbM family methyltransferase
MNPVSLARIVMRRLGLIHWDRRRAFRQWNWLPKDDIHTVIDAGAHEGSFTAQALAMFPKATVYAFEPQQSSFRTLAIKFAGVPRVKLRRLALGAVNEQLPFHEAEDRATSSLLPASAQLLSEFPAARLSSETEVEVSRLDSVFLDIPTPQLIMLKLDVQGTELDVLRGAGAFLKRIDIVYCEMSFYPIYDGQSTFRELFAFLSDAGFHFAGVESQHFFSAAGRPLQADGWFLSDVLWAAWLDEEPSGALLKPS